MEFVSGRGYPEFDSMAAVAREGDYWDPEIENANRISLMLQPNGSYELTVWTTPLLPWLRYANVADYLDEMLPETYGLPTMAELADGRYLILSDDPYLPITDRHQGVLEFSIELDAAEAKEYYERMMTATLGRGYRWTWLFRNLPPSVAPGGLYLVVYRDETRNIFGPLTEQRARQLYAEARHETPDNTQVDALISADCQYIYLVKGGKQGQFVRLETNNCIGCVERQPTLKFDIAK